MPSNRRLPPDPIRIANRTSDEEFIAAYLPPNFSEWMHPATHVRYELRLVCVGAMEDGHLDACLALLEHTSSEDYRLSKTGWDPEAKREEMELEDMRYLLVLGPNDDGDDEGADGGDPGRRVCGFTSVMPVWEDGYPVLYCYELHLEESVRCTGLGRHLLDLTLEMGRRMTGVVKVMLTCFVRNERAQRFYARMGFVVDDFSPEVRVLRSGRVVPDYTILSHAVPSSVDS